MKCYCLFASTKETPDHQAVTTPSGLKIWIRVIEVEKEDDTQEDEDALTKALDYGFSQCRPEETVLNSIPPEFGLQ